MANPKATSLPVTCPDFEAISGTKRCRHYLAGGACSRPDHFMCDEWLKVNPPPARARPPEQSQLFGPPVPLPNKAPSAVPPQRAAPAVRPSIASPELQLNAQNLREEDVASFKALGIEVCLATEAVGEVWLVPEYTGGERTELSIEHAALLAAVGAVFPGAKVTALLRRSSQKLTSSSPR